MQCHSLYIYGNQRIFSKLVGKRFLYLLLSFISFSSVTGQDSLLQTQNFIEGRKTVIAGEQYKASSFHQWLWGKHYRKEWVTPVNVPILNLDKVNGGLTAYEAGGGRQTKTLRLRNPEGKEYVLRSIDKTLGKAMPDLFRGTFIEKIMNDQVSTAHPYAALTIPGMAKAAQIYHCNPVIGFVPRQKALGDFNVEFGNDLYLFEQRADENWKEEPNFGNSSEIIATDKMLEKLWEESDRRIDQVSFIRARIFDMFVGDWGRHEDQWRWAKIDEDGKELYRAIPRDRDQVYTKFDGVLVSIFKAAAGAGHVKSFDYTIENIRKYNFPARYLDRQAANETTREQWVSVAKELQQLLTNEVIENSVKQLPPEVFPISGDEIIAKLKSRRDNLVEFATEYYKELAKEVEITGTKKKELFEIIRVNNEQTTVNVYDLNKEEEPKKEPFYSRSFLAEETNEIRLYGLDENDQYRMSGDLNKGILVRIIGGPAKDQYIDSIKDGPQKNIRIYDNADNEFNTAAGSKLYLSESDSVHVYRYNDLNYDVKGIKKIFFYNNEDRIHIGLGYEIEKHKWRTYPYAYKQEVNLKYSIMEKAFSTEYKGTFIEAFGKWNAILYANFDWIRWINYFGVGNTTKRVLRGRDNVSYYRMRTRQLLTSAGLSRNLSANHKVGISGFYQTYDVVKDEGRYVADHPTNTNGDDYIQKNFAGAVLDYTYQKVNDPVLPTKGMRFLSTVSYTRDIKDPEKSFGRFTSVFTLYVPLWGSFNYFLKTGFATATGTPEFYQLNIIGGGQTLRGYKRFRFYGRTSFFGQNELQWIRPVNGRIFNGKAGLLGLVDVGRVWHPGEKSNLYHLSVGGGFILAPFNKVSVAATYATSREDATINFRFSRNL
jgi:hypothetical protein